MSMRELEKIPVCEEIKKLADKFPTDIFIVGGKVRNFLMGVDTEDIDLCSSLSLSALEEIVKNYGFELKFKNEQLQTAKIVINDKLYDYARFRTEIYEKGGFRLPKEVEFVKTPQEDYLRRDFSVNSIYYNLKTGKYLDFCGGIQDLKNKVIKTVSSPKKVLADDGLRILRMIRVACEMSFKIDRETFIAASQNISNLLNVSGVKLANEIKKICDSSKHLCAKKNAHIRGIKLLNKLKAWKYFGFNFDKLKPKMLNTQVKKYYGLLIDIINAEDPASISYFLAQVLDRLEIGKRKKEEIINIISGYFDALNKVSNKIYFSKYFDHFEEIYKILYQKSKLTAQKYHFFYKYIINHKLVVKVSDLKVSNKDLAKNFPSLPEKSYNIILNMVLTDVFEGKYPNENERILKEIEKKLNLS